MSLLLEYAQRIEDSSWATDLHESFYMFPLIEGSHLLGLALSVGLLAIIDLRLLGVILTDVPKAQLLKQLRPWLLWGFVATFATGLILLATQATEAFHNPAFLYKLLFIAFAGINALVFELNVVRKWATDEHVSKFKDRLAGGISLSLWVLVIVSGRLIPYLASH